MSINITESDRLDYDAQECKNMTLQEFVRQRMDEKRDMARSAQVYKSIPSRSSKEDIGSLKLPGHIKDAVPRAIVIDGANIMHGGSSDPDKRPGVQSKNVPDVGALLSVMRFFTVRGFEAFAVISRGFAKHGATNFKEAIDRLVENNLCVVVPTSNLDDIIALEFAAQINGVVVTSDKYRDHATESARMERIVKENRIEIKWDSLGKDKRHTVGSTPETDYLPTKRFFFHNDIGSMMSSDEIMKRVYCFPDQLQYAISKERSELALSNHKKNKVLYILEDLIVKGKYVYKKNVEAILNMPVFTPQQPAEGSSRSQSESDNGLQEVPRDSQANFIADFPNDDTEW